MDNPKITNQHYKNNLPIYNAYNANNNLHINLNENNDNTDNTYKAR